MTRLEKIRELQKIPYKKAEVTIGLKFSEGDNVVIGGEGFGWELNERGEYEFMPHMFGVIIGSNVSIGSNTCIDRGSSKDTWIASGCKIDNLVHIAHNVEIHHDTLVVAGSVICGSVTIGHHSYIGANVTIREHLKIGNNSYIGMGSVVTKNVGDNEMWYGNPAKFIKTI